MEENEKCKGKTQIYSRVVGFFAPVDGWNKGKRDEFKDRVTFDVNSSLEKKG